MTADQSRSWRGWSALVLIVIAIGAMRLRLASISLERDEGEYAYAGQLLLRGVPPYQSAYNMKFPGTYVMYAVILDTAGRIWGQTPTALRVGVAVVNAADLILVFALSRRFWTPAASIAAAATFGLLSLNQGAQAIMGHATHFVLLPAMAGLWFLIPAKDDPASEWLLSKVMLRCAIGGLFLALAILMKQPGIFFAPFGYFWWASQTIGHRRIRLARTNLAAGTVSFAGGFALPLLIFGGWLWHAGVFGRFWFWTITYARVYGSATSLAVSIGELKHTIMSLTAGGQGVIWGAAVAAFGVASVAGRRSPSRRSGILFIAALGIASMCATSVGLYFRPHYFILMMPVAALAIAAFIDTPILSSVRWRLVLLATVCGVFFYMDAEPLFTRSSAQVMWKMYNRNPFPESPGVGKYIREHTRPQDRVAVLGSEPQILFYADRISATGYIYTYPLMELHPYAHQMQQEMAAEIEAAKPPYVVLVNEQMSWLRRSDSDQWITVWSAKFLENYARVKMPVDVPASSLWVYRRKEMSE